MLASKPSDNSLSQPTPKHNHDDTPPIQCCAIAEQKIQYSSMQNQAPPPVKSLHDYKFWPHVARVDNVFGDRNPVCSCVGMENYS